MGLGDGLPTSSLLVVLVSDLMLQQSRPVGVGENDRVARHVSLELQL